VKILPLFDELGVTQDFPPQVIRFGGKMRKGLNRQDQRSYPAPKAGALPALRYAPTLSTSTTLLKQRLVQL
jgi:hypothetical protein